MIDVRTESLVDQVRVVRQQSFQFHSKELKYTVSRGVVSSLLDRSPWQTQGYVQILPELDGLNVMEFIQQVIDTKGQARLLDVGCGSARFLNQCKNGYRVDDDRGLSLRKEGWKELVQCFGLTSHLYRFCNTDGTPKNREEELAKYCNAGIQLDVYDAQNLANFYPGQTFDVITAAYVAEHIADPWALFYGMYEKLSEEGGCFIKGIPFRMCPQDETDIAEFLRFKHRATVTSPYIERGVSFALSGDIAIRKRLPKLQLPIEYDLVNPSFPPRVIYKFDMCQEFIPILSG